MHARLIRVGNSQGIVPPKKLLQQYHLAGEVDLRPTPDGLLITPIGKLNTTRPCVVISPDKLTCYLRTVTIAALMSSQRAYPSRGDCAFQGKVDRSQAVDKTRLVRG